MIAAKLDQLTNLLVRPRRRTYQQTALGPAYFQTKFGFCMRHDFEVEFKFGLTYGYPSLSSSLQEGRQHPTIMLKCSIFLPSASPQNSHRRETQTCVLGLHGNTGSRISTISLLEPVLSFGMSFAIFDFAGCGNSEGEYVTLGYYQKYQIAAVLELIHKKYGYHRFVLYGRSMGAASALFYSTYIYPQYLNHKNKLILNHYATQVEKNCQSPRLLILSIIQKLNSGQFGYEVIGAILDSPYYDTNQLFMGAVARRLWFLPSFLISYLLNTVEANALEKLKGFGMTAMEEPSLQTQANRADQSKDEIQSKSQQMPSIFSLVNDIKIPLQPQMPYSTFLLYGLQDEIISQNHIWELFKKIKCENKKLYVIQDQGHGGHRDDTIKINSLEWVLNLDRQRFIKTVIKSTYLLQVSLQDYFECKIENGGEKKSGESPTKKNASEKTIDIKTGNTFISPSFETGQVENQFGSNVSLQDSLGQVKKDYGLIKQIRQRLIQLKVEKKTGHKIIGRREGEKLLSQIGIEVREWEFNSQIGYGENLKNREWKKMRQE